MNHQSLFVLKLSAVLGCGLVAGVFFAFSTFVMKALAGLPANQGISAMQAINIAVINPIFMILFMGTAGLCVLLTISGLMNRNQPGAVLLITGSLLYIVGTFGVTAACNVPLNDALAKLDPSHAESATAWGRYVSNWMLWNHVRMVAALAATAALTLALCQRVSE